MYEKVGDEKIVAKPLKGPITQYVFRNLQSRLYNKMRELYPWIKHKQSFTAKVLHEIGKRLNQGSEDKGFEQGSEDKGFEHCMTYLTNVRTSLAFWAEYFVKSYCNSGSPSALSKMLQDELNEVIDFVKKQATTVTASCSCLEEITFKRWVTKFHSAVIGKIQLSLVEFTVFCKDQKLSHLDFFTGQVLEILENIRQELRISLASTTYSDTCRRESAHLRILQDVVGCTEQCPFCGAQCEYHRDHNIHSKKHSTSYCPQCLNKYRWIENKESILDICTFVVATNANFKNKVTRGKLHPYTRYYDYYPSWIIPVDKSFEASLYWKWFLGNYYSKIKEEYGHAETEIPHEWKIIKWRNVEEQLRDIMDS